MADIGLQRRSNAPTRAPTPITDWRRVRRELQQHSPAHRAHDSSLTATLAQLAFVLAAAAFFAIVAALARAGQFEIWLAAITGVLISVALLTLGQAKPWPQRVTLAATWTFVIGVTLAGLHVAQAAGFTG